MSLQTVGLVFLLVSAGFFLNWGYSDSSVNTTSNVIFGAILGVLGISFLMYRNPLADTTQKFVSVANKILDDSSALLSSNEADEKVKRINVEARKATREIKERAQARIQKIN